MTQTHLPVTYLLKEAQRLNLVRWVTAALGGLVVFFVLPRAEMFWASAVLLGIVFILAGVFELLYRSIQNLEQRNSQQASRRLMWYFCFQVVYQVPILLVAIHLTGGPLSLLPLILLLYLGMFAVVFPTRRLALLTAFLCLVMCC